MKLEYKISKRITIDLRKWSLWRIARMFFAVLFLSAGIYSKDLLLGLGGLFLFAHSLLSICEKCAVNTCEIPKENDKF